MDNCGQLTINGRILDVNGIMTGINQIFHSFKTKYKVPKAKKSGDLTDFLTYTYMYI